ncbi:aminoglycoside 3-N-acetyltransferase [Anoxybacillus calidus]|jgi:aminoglycoside 3-N-acetyltransferase|uniref:Aminoglycoside N(3)-acetyltransferase n=1 Tax=[Anoxybacillus] calidus TaxID=575178 RepID=A0A7V9YXN8_9BACL|nr:AAC(3) family N-acetyltransferase [Anoxybacillus calidus]MBA2870337.1 aminoglycoside 3-N-acetyltransferase [Anoxybacillus calidus]
MSEFSVVEQTKKLITKETLKGDFKRLGIEEGMTLIVHSSLSAFGWVCGGAVTVVQALMEAVTESGTIVMPTQTTYNSEPSYWQHPPVPEEWWERIREHMPAYEPAITPTRGMGVIVETFRTFPGVIRSAHPMYSFAAWGRHKEEIIDNHSIDYGFGEQSPLARIYDLDGHVLLLGVGYDSNTSMHLAEFRSSKAKTFQQGAAMMENGKRVWKTFIDIETDADRFPQIGAAFENVYHVAKDKVGNAECRIMKQRELVDFTLERLERNG